MPAVRACSVRSARLRAPKRAVPLAILCAAVAALVPACGQVPAPGAAGSRGTVATEPLPPGVMSAARACRLVLGRAAQGFFTRVEQVHLVLTSYAKGEPVESQGDISSGMPADTLVWVVEVHAEAIHWDHSAPSAHRARASQGAPSRILKSPRPDTDFSVVMNARTGWASDAGECTCWPLPLGRLGSVISLPPGC
jgi:hypothetical protein